MKWPKSPKGTHTGSIIPGPVQSEIEAGLTSHGITGFETQGPVAQGQVSIGDLNHLGDTNPSSQDSGTER